MAQQEHTVSSVEMELQRIKAKLPRRLDLMALTGETQGLREALDQLYGSVHELIDVVFILEGVLRDEAPHPSLQLQAPLKPQLEPQLKVANG